MAKIQESITIQEQIYNLFLELVQAEKDKKIDMKTHADNIKRIKEEMTELIDEAESEVVDAQKVG